MTALTRAIIALTATALAGSAAAQPLVVTGTGDPDTDVPAVQAAVDQGSSVVLTGHFSFDRPPTTPDGSIYARMVTVSREVVISGARDDNGEMPTIEGGNWPFFIDAAGAHVTIEGLHFVNSNAGAIWTYAVSGLTIAYCRIESPEANAEFGREANVTTSLAGGIVVAGDAPPPSVTRPGKPENFSGTLAIVNNDIDMGGTPGALFLGVVLFSVGKSPDHEVDIYVSGNKVSNVTEPAINLRLVGGRAHVERNVITTGAVTGGAANPDALRIVGSGSYVIAHNSIDCGWPEGTATGINLFGQSSPLPAVAGAIVADNDVTMSAPAGTVFAANSAAIEIGGVAQGNAVLNNRLHGRAGAALAVVGRNSRTPANNTFVSNDVQDFRPSLAGIFVDAGVTNTVIVGQPTSVQDHGSGTVVAPMP